MKWETGISFTSGGEEILRGHDLLKLAREKSFAEAVYLAIKGELPADNQARMLSAMLVLGIDHGVGTASAMTARIIASAGTATTSALAGGILALGERHGGAIEGAAKFFQENAGAKDVAGLVAKLREQKTRIPGYGHKVLERDRRSETLFEIAKETKIYGRHCEFAEKVHSELNAVSSKKLPLNIDGAMAAVLSDMGFDWRLATGIFVIARIPGLLAHVYEEQTQGEGLRRLPEEDIKYTGSEPRAK